jgi:hypothetical protein
MKIILYTDGADALANDAIGFLEIDCTELVGTMRLEHKR